jgi:SOS response regulatory protein OraA/RecX
LQQVHDSKFGQTVPDNRKELAKRARFLEYRGFPGELIGDFLLRKH